MKDKEGEVFNPLKAIEDAGKIHTLKDKILGKVRYTPLSNEDMWAVTSIEDQKAKTTEILFRLLSKANPLLKKEDLSKLPMTTSARLLTILLPNEEVAKKPVEAK